MRRTLVAGSIVICGLAVALMGGNALARTGSPPANPPASQLALLGSWRSAHLHEGAVVNAFVAAGGSREEGHAFFAQLGGGTTSYAVITLRFDVDGSFEEFESADGGPAVEGYTARAVVQPGATLELRNPNCVGTYGYEIAEDTLRLTVIEQCSGPDAPYNTTLFASFPFTHVG